MIPQYQEKTGHHKIVRMFSLGVDLLGRGAALISSPSVSIRSNNHVSVQLPQPQKSESSFANSVAKVSHTKTYMQGMDFVKFLTKICHLPPSL